MKNKPVNCGLRIRISENIKLRNNFLFRDWSRKIHARKNAI